MKQRCIRADSFVLKSRRIRIYRVRQRGTGTVLWTSADAAIRYLKELQSKRLQASRGGRKGEGR